MAFITQEAESQKGYMGKGNELGIDLFNAFYQGAYELEYKGSLNKHLGIILTAGYYGSKKEYEEFEQGSPPVDGDPLSSTTTGPTFGIGLGHNRARLDMAYPIGYCMSYGYKVSLLEIEDVYGGLDDPVRYEHNVHQLYIRFERNYNLTDHIDVQLSVRTGTMLSRAVPDVKNTEETEGLEPLRALPAKHPFSTGGTYQLQKFPDNELRFRLFLMPNVRVSYLF